MNPKPESKRWPLVRAVLVLQIKLLLNAARDLILIPLAVVAAIFDLARLKTHEPVYFRRMLRIGESSDRWIDLWSGHDEHAAPRENVDALLARVEEVVRDPKSGARRARVLKRWAERQIARARRGPAAAGSANALDEGDLTPQHSRPPES